MMTEGRFFFISSLGQSEVRVRRGALDSFFILCPEGSFGIWIVRAQWDEDD